MTKYMLFTLKAIGALIALYLCGAGIVSLSTNNRAAGGMTFGCLLVSMAGYLFLLRDSRQAEEKPRSWVLMWWAACLICWVVSLVIYGKLSGPLPDMRLHFRGYPVAAVETLVVFSSAILYWTLWVRARRIHRGNPPELAIWPVLQKGRAQGLGTAAAGGIASDLEGNPEADRLERIRRGQRLVIFSIALAVIANALRAEHLLEALLIYVAALFPIGVGLYKLGIGLGYSRAKMAAIFAAQLIPLLNIVVLVVMNMAAANVLRKAGYEVGILGAARR